MLLKDLLSILTFIFAKDSQIVRLQNKSSFKKLSLITYLSVRGIVVVHRNALNSLSGTEVRLNTCHQSSPDYRFG